MAAPRTPSAKPSLGDPPALWDPVVRLTHWGIAVSVLVNAALDEGGSLLHVSLGWLVMALLLLRMVWGVLGPGEARFSAFPPNPLAALRHLRQLVSGRVRHYPSHNPAGAIMAYAFWACLAVVTVTGLVMFLAGTSLLLVAAAVVVWIASLWLSAPPPPSPLPPARDGVQLTPQGMHDLIEHSALPMLVLDGDRIIIANAAAREALGGHVIGQDARVALRHPAAVELVSRQGGGSVSVQGLTGPRSSWQMSRQLFDRRYSLIELINRTAEIDISRAHTDFVVASAQPVRAVERLEVGARVLKALQVHPTLLSPASAPALEGVLNHSGGGLAIPTSSQPDAEAGEGDFIR